MRFGSKEAAEKRVQKALILDYPISNPFGELLILLNRAFSNLKHAASLKGDERLKSRCSGR